MKSQSVSYTLSDKNQQRVQDRVALIVTQALKAANGKDYSDFRSTDIVLDGLSIEDPRIRELWPVASTLRLRVLSAGAVLLDVTDFVNAPKEVFLKLDALKAGKPLSEVGSESS